MPDEILATTRFYPGRPGVSLRRSCYMARIRWINESEAGGEAGEVYGEWMAKNPGRPHVPEILKCLSLRPDLLRGMIEISDRVHFADGHLTRRLKEMIATYVSALNRCPF